MPHLHLSADEADVIYLSEHVHLTSVGIDIGSSTSHLMFSDLVLHRQGRHHSSRFVVTRRQVRAVSPVHLTPYRSATAIDVDRLDALIRAGYAAAGLDPDGIDTGAVIMTGEAAKKENAAPILSLFAAQAGKFVCATAGPNLEAVLAAHGSGAVARSRRDDGCTVLNVDIGGGTTKLAVASAGRVVGTSAVNVGARLLAWDDGDRLVRIEEAGRRIAADCGLDLRVGDAITAAARERLAARMADLLLATMTGADDPLAAALHITPPLRWQGRPDAWIFSGGVAEYIYGREARSFNDLGPLLAAALRARTAVAGLPPVEEPTECLRATCIGASQYTVQVSGNTIYVSDPGLLPLRNVPVLTPEVSGGVDAERWAAAIRASYARFDLAEGEGQPAALAIRWPYDPSYQALRALADAIAAAHPRTLAAGRPLVLVLDSDVARLLGRLLVAELAVPAPVICIDQVHLSDLDFVDIGALLSDQQVVPVVVKSLVFK